MHERSLRLFLSFGTSVTLDEFLAKRSLVHSAVVFSRGRYQKLCAATCASRESADILHRIGKVAGLRHAKRRAPRQFRLLLLIESVYPRGDLMLPWLLCSPSSTAMSASL